MNPVSQLPVAPKQASAILLYSKASSDHAEKVQRARQLLETAWRDHSPVVQASSLGVEDMVIAHLIAELALDIPTIVLNTGKLHTQTLDLLDEMAQRYGRKPTVFLPNSAAATDFESEHGERAMFASVALRKQCCHIRKVEPLARALDGQRAWITGLRSEQSANRSAALAIEFSSSPEGTIAKINPLIDWTWGDVWHFVQANAVPYNPLHDAFFPSIGCAPCTRAISVGEDFRAGRWWWEDASAKECGLHSSHTDTP